MLGGLSINIMKQISVGVHISVPQQEVQVGNQMIV